MCGSLFLEIMQKFCNRASIGAQRDSDKMQTDVLQFIDSGWHKWYKWYTVTTIILRLVFVYR